MLAEAVPAPAVWSVDEYERDTAHVRSSGLKCLADEGAAIYHGRYVTGALPSPDTAALRRGRLVHAAILEPDRFAREVMRGGPVNPKTGRHYGRDTLAFAQWEDAQRAEGVREFVTDSEHDALVGMRDAVLGCPVVAGWLRRATGIERALRWRDPCGLLCKARLDAECDHLVLDIKSTSNPVPERFARATESYGYFGQAAHYLEGAAAERGCAIEELVYALVVVEATPPHRVAIYELIHEEWIAPGVEWRRRWIDELAYRFNADDWRSPWESTPMILSPRPGFERRVLPWRGE